MTALAGWLTRPLPRGRVAALRVLLYTFLPLDLLVFTPWVAAHASTPGSLYQPLLVGRLLHLPTPTALLVHALEVGLLTLSPLAGLLALRGRGGRLARALGVAVFALYAEWMVVAMSYGKVDHDRFALLVALAVLPTVATARPDDRRPDEAAGFAVAAVELAVVATYLLSTVAKLRFGDGLHWLDGATFTWAVVRRGTPLSTPLLGVPVVLRAGQAALVAVELASPLLLLEGRRVRGVAVGRWLLVGFGLFHLATFAGITISFLPHVVCLSAFLPLERLPDQLCRRQLCRRLSSRRPAAVGSLPAAAAAPVSARPPA